MDPSLVRGKKIKNEEGDKKCERDIPSPEMSPSEDDVYYDQSKPMMILKHPPMASGPLMLPQEDILKRKAEILKCQGAYLQFQASLLEREAHNTMRATEERVRMMREMMAPVYKEDTGYPGHWSAEDGYERPPAYPEYREERILYPQRTESPVPLCPDNQAHDEDESEHPLDLSVTSPVSPNLHAQSQNMPRIFFSLSGPRR